MKSWRWVVMVLFATGAMASAQGKAPAYRVIVMGAPYSATRVTTRYATVDGKQVEHVTTGREARNASGWQWYERIVADSKGRPETWNIIWNPMEHTRSEWSTRKMTAYQKQFGEPALARARVQPLPGGMETSDGRNPRLSVRVTPLESRTIDGVETVGTETVRVLKPAVGSTAIEQRSVTQSWYSEQLHMVMLSTTDDSTRGKTRVELTDLKTVDPDATLFQVPARVMMQPSREMEQFQ